MTVIEIEQSVKRFIKQFHITSVDFDSLRLVTEELGYTLVSFNNISNDEDVATLARSLRLTENIRHSKCFTYADQNFRLIFVHEDLTDEEKTLVISHELGHIYLGHMSNAQILGSDVHEEHDANEFSHFLLEKFQKQKGSIFFARHKPVIIAISAILLIALISVFTVVGVGHYENSKKNKYVDYYITATGGKYHEKDCGTLKKSRSVRRMTQRELDSGLFERCHTCLPPIEE